jgi:hypothetical protein
MLCNSSWIHGKERSSSWVGHHKHKSLGRGSLRILEFSLDGSVQTHIILCVENYLRTRHASWSFDRESYSASLCFSCFLEYVECDIPKFLDIWRRKQRLLKLWNMIELKNSFTHITLVLASCYLRSTLGQHAHIHVGT